MIQLPRIIEINFIPNPLHGSSAVFLWGPRQTGKTTVLGQRFPTALTFDLLDTSLAADLAIRPSLLRERVLAAINHGDALLAADRRQAIGHAARARVLRWHSGRARARQLRAIRARLSGHFGAKDTVRVDVEGGRIVFERVIEAEVV